MMNNTLRIRKFLILNALLMRMQPRFSLILIFRLVLDHIIVLVSLFLLIERLYSYYSCCIFIFFFSGERFGLMGSKIGIIEIISNFYLECSENTPQPIEFDPKSFILQPVGGLPLKCIPIHRKMSMAG